MTAVIDSAPAAQAEPPTSPGRGKKQRKRWRPSFLTLLICLFALAGSGVGLYPSTAAWFSSYNQAQIIKDGMGAMDELDPTVEEQLAMAHAYNDALQAGVALESGAPVPTGFGESTGEFSYRDVLNANPEGLMSRVKIDDINVDLPVYHGTDHETLLKGAGHLEGSHLPVGGLGTRSVITAHRGLATATMFNDLNKLKAGQRLTLNTLGEVLTYEIRESMVIEPHDTAVLRPEAGRDLVTLITCTPLGVNSHRIVVTAERVTPTPYGDVEAATADPGLPTPWWAVIGAGLLLLILAYLVRSGYADARRVDAKKARAAALAAGTPAQSDTAVISEDDPVAGFGTADTNQWRVSHDGIEKT